uniref:Secretoglobin family 2A member 2 n=1 Tax=Canis lupus familiaris TaxID=9615 RepID=A0A8C0RCR6_CANLF
RLPKRLHLYITENTFACFFPGSGCLLLEEAINKAIDSQVSIDEYQNFLQPFTYGLETKEAIAELKQCFLQQSDETLSNFALMMNKIYNSYWCALF